VVGDFTLAQRIDGLAEARAKSDVNVQWCYPFSALGEDNAHRLTGSVLVKKRAP
jgi:hypothetical protein